MTDTPRIAVTGSNGFIGRHVVERAAVRGDNVLALTRGNGPDLLTASAEDWAKALAGCGCCIHLAAALPGADSKSMFRANVDGAVALLEGAARAGVSHLVFVSSIGVLGYRTTPERGPMRHDDPHNPVGDYACSKAAAEKALSERAAALGVALAILRPPMVYGPSTKGSYAALVRLAKRVPVLPFGGVDSKRDLVGVRNLSDCLLALARERIEGVFHVKDRQTVSMTDLTRKILRANGIKGRLVTLPGPLRRMAMAAPGVGRTAERLFGDLEVDDSSLAAASAWVPPYTLDDEIAFSVIGDGRADGVAR